MWTGSKARGIAILLWGDYSRVAMGGASAGRLRREKRATIQRDTSATAIPATTSSQKWLAVASTQNQTQAGQSAQPTLTSRRRAARQRKMPTISASAACRLGIAAYGLASAPTR